MSLFFSSRPLEDSFEALSRREELFFIPGSCGNEKGLSPRAGSNLSIDPSSGDIDIYLLLLLCSASLGLLQAERETIPSGKSQFPWGLK